MLKGLAFLAIFAFGFGSAIISKEVIDYTKRADEAIRQVKFHECLKTVQECVL